MRIKARPQSAVSRAYHASLSLCLAYLSCFTLTSFSPHSNDIGSILRLKKVTCNGEGVSWTARPFDYYIQTVDRSFLEFFFAAQNGKPVLVCDAEDDDQDEDDDESEEEESGSSQFLAVVAPQAQSERRRAKGRRSKRDGSVSPDSIFEEELNDVADKPRRHEKPTGDLLHDAYMEETAANLSRLLEASKPAANRLIVNAKAQVGHCCYIHPHCLAPLRDVA